MVDPTRDDETLGILPFHIAYLFAVVLAVILATGTATRLVHPRFVPLIWIALAACVGIGVVHRLFARHTTRRHGLGYLGYLVLVLVLPGAFINETSLAGINGMDLATAARVQSSPRPAGVGNEWADGIAGEIGRSSPEYRESAAVPDLVVLTEDDYYRIYNDIYDRREAYLGKQLRVTGFVNKDESISDGGRFLVARMVMWCCAADAYLVGFIVLGGAPETLQAGSWVTIRGTVVDTEYTNPMTNERYTVPGVRLESIDSASAPQNPYVIPDF
jgi:uncharacterized repeat protein (TIGR03943 family)